MKNVMDIKIEAKALLNEIQNNGQVVPRDKKRRLVELCNEITGRYIKYSVGCSTCVRKAHYYLTEHFKSEKVVQQVITNEVVQQVETNEDKPKRPRVKKIKVD